MRDWWRVSSGQRHYENDLLK